LIVVKRYPNRKLYDTEARQYITLEGIAALIRLGYEVHVVDHATGEDLTALTLTQVIFELQKTRSGFLPKNVLEGLILAGGDTLGSLRRGLAPSLDLARQVDEEIDRRMRILVSLGELEPEEGVRLRDQLLAHGRQPSSSPDDALEQALIRRGLVTRREFEEMLEQVERLQAKVAEIDRLG
jgi:polyhydroxyalkanoate synthesis repressor PhaR